MARTRSTRRTRKRSTKRAQKGGLPAAPIPDPINIVFLDTDFRGGAAVVIKKVYEQGVKPWFSKLSRGTNSAGNPTEKDAFLSRFPSGMPEFPQVPRQTTWPDIITNLTQKGGLPAAPAPAPITITFNDSDFRGGVAVVIKKVYEQGVKPWFNMLSRGKNSAGNPTQKDAFLSRFPSGMPEFPKVPRQTTWPDIITSLSPAAKGKK